jgi:hypothetical protein
MMTDGNWSRETALIETLHNPVLINDPGTSVAIPRQSMSRRFYNLSVPKVRREFVKWRSGGLRVWRSLAG